MSVSDAIQKSYKYMQFNTCLKEKEYNLKLYEDIKSQYRQIPDKVRKIIHTMYRDVLFCFTMENRNIINVIALSIVKAQLEQVHRLHSTAYLWLAIQNAFN